MKPTFRYVLIVSVFLLGSIVMSSEKPAVYPAEQFCITEGRIVPSDGPWMRVESTKMRAVLGLPGKPEAELRFRYLGETEDHSKLLSGGERTQLGLKLKAQDDCNVLYVMWRISPVSSLVVSVKSNPGQHRHAECGNSGYTNIRGTFTGAVPKIVEGSEHSLHAVQSGSSLTVDVDGAPTWQGNVGEDALHFDGPVGMRSDNARFDFQFIAHPAGGSFACDKNRTE
jgi:hypothetical protein